MIELHRLELLHSQAMRLETSRHEAREAWIKACRARGMADGEIVTRTYQFVTSDRDFCAIARMLFAHLSRDAAVDEARGIVSAAGLRLRVKDDALAACP